MQLQRESLFKKLRELLTCPLSRSPISDPVVTSVGNTYERKALDAWLGSNSTDPISGTELTHREIVPNDKLREVINFLEREIPELEKELAESQNTIRDLNDKIDSIRDVLGERSEKEDSEQFLQTTTERTKKTKKIRKEVPAQKERENSRLKEALAENDHHCKIINELRAKEISYEQKINDYKAQISQISEDNSALEYDFNLLKYWREAQRIALDHSISFANNYFEASFKYHEKLLNVIQAEFKKIIQGQNVKHLADTDIVEFASVKVLEQLEGQRNVKHAPSSAPVVCQQFDRVINFGRIERLMQKKFKKNIITLSSIYDNQHMDVYLSLALNQIPYSSPATKEELQISWSQVRKIHTGVLTPVDQNTWNELMQNIDQFSSLKHLEIEFCNVAEMNVGDLEKLKKLDKITFKKATFSQETQKNLAEFMKKYSWIDVAVKRL